MLSAMCVPDLQGSQGTYTYYATDPQNAEEVSVDAIGTEHRIGGNHIQVTIRDGKVDTHLPGPANPMRRDGKPLHVPLVANLDPERGRAMLRIGR